MEISFYGRGEGGRKKKGKGAKEIEQGSEKAEGGRQEERREGDQKILGNRRMEETGKGAKNEQIIEKKRGNESQCVNASLCVDGRFRVDDTL